MKLRSNSVKNHVNAKILWIILPYAKWTMISTVLQGLQLRLKQTWNFFTEQQNGYFLTLYDPFLLVDSYFPALVASYQQEV